MTNPLFRFYKFIKVQINHLFDRIIDLSNMFLMDIYQFSWSGAQNITHWIARYVGDLIWLLRDFPRLDAYKLTGANWVIIFVGGKQGLLEICHLFFADETVAPQEIGRVALWGLSAQAQKWLDAGVDLVICELSRVCPPLKAPFAFTVPSWICQILPLPEPLEALLSGNAMKSIRHNLNRAQKANFGWYFSQARADFDDFHYNMYRPFIKSRHGGRALVGTYEDQRKCWFEHGGLIVITQNNTRVGGLLCYVRKKTCYAVEVGVLNSDPQLLEQGIKISSDWFTMRWAYQQGVRVYDMGATRPWRTNGVFIYKSRWRSNVIRQKRIYGVWTFLAQNLSPALRDHINNLGFISEIDGKFCAVWVSPDGASPSKEELSHIADEGLNGWLVVSPHQRQVILCPTEHNNL